MDLPKVVQMSTFANEAQNEDEALDYETTLVILAKCSTSTYFLK